MPGAVNAADRGNWNVAFGSSWYLFLGQWRLWISDCAAIPDLVHNMRQRLAQMFHVPDLSKPTQAEQVTVSCILWIL